jgi:hypothetical protein
MKPSLEIFVLEPGSVSVRLSHRHGVWGHGSSVPEAIRSCLRTAKSFDLPFRLDDYYAVVLVDTVHCDAFTDDGEDLYAKKAS